MIGWPGYGSEAGIAAGLAATRRRYADSYRDALSEAARLSDEWLAGGRALPCQRPSLMRQLAHAIASTAMLRRSSPGLSKGATKMDLAMTCNRLDEAGAALSALGEDVVLLAFYRGGHGYPDDRYSVRLALDGTPSGIQESAATPSAAFTRAVAARAQRQRSLAAEAALRAEMAQRSKAERR